MREKLGLGTVQFGQAYGVSNTGGQVSRQEAAHILEGAAKAGIRLLDTAANYGEAESVLASLNATRFRIVTKTIAISHGLEAVIARARQSGASLGADTLLVHAASDLQGDEGAALWKALLGLRQEGVFRKIGISAYVADAPRLLAERFHPDVLQVPFSLLDQRLLKEGTLGQLEKQGVEVHARSLFLQGLLFLQKLPAKLQHTEAHLKEVRQELSKSGTTPLAAALGFALSRPEISFGLVGVTSAQELNQIVTAADEPLPALDWQRFALDDEVVLTPSLW
jgi:aryl-alcohol dehydrogenase-like predicted oxidoreductase